MSVSNNIYPHTRAEDERLVQRGQSSFGSGMVSDVDPVDVPSDGVYDLDNMRATPNGLSGRPGSFIWSTLKLPYEWETVTGTIIDDDTIGVRAPALPFTRDMIGYKISVPGTRTVLFITDVDDDNPYRASFSGNLADGVSSITFNLRGPLNASFVDELNGSSYYLIGNKLFGRLLDTDDWVEYFISSENSLHSSASTFYKINKFICLSNKNAILVLNDIEDASYTWRANSPIPIRKLNRTLNVSTDQNKTGNNPISRYNYAYGYSRFKDTYTGSRLSELSFIQRESPSFLHTSEDVDNTDYALPYYPDGNNTDYTTIEHSKPCGGNAKHVLRVGGSWSHGVGPSAHHIFNNVLSFTIVYDGTRYFPSFDFRKASTWEEGASIIETSLRNNVNRDLGVGYREEYDSGITTIYIDIYSTNLTEFSFPRDEPIGTKINMFTDIYAYGARILWDDGVEYYSNQVKYFVYPISAKDVTHYTLHRSADIYPHTLDLLDVYDPRIQNKPELLGWVDDIPVCKCSDSYILGNKLTQIGSGANVLNVNDIGNIIKFNEKELEILHLNTDGTFTISGDYSYERGFAYFGAETILAAHKYGNSVEVIGDSVFTTDDIGRLIYWEDGTYSLVINTELDSSSGKINAITSDNIDRINDAAVIRPTSRVYTDMLQDSKLNSYISSFPFNMRFFNEMPNTNIASYARGILLSATRDSGLLSFSDATDIARIGYKNSSSQINNTIQEGVKSIVNAHGYFTVATGADTYVINPSQSQTIGNPLLGEAYTQLPDPILSASGIGSTHQTKWAEGLNEGLIAVTNEPALRTYNGMQYGEDMSAGKIKRSELQKIDSMVIVGFDANSGIYLWGKGAGV